MKGEGNSSVGGRTHELGFNGVGGSVRSLCFVFKLKVKDNERKKRTEACFYLLI